MKAPILLVGTARSGLGIIAEVLHMCGAFGGSMAGVQLPNETGLYENVSIRDGVNEWMSHHLQLSVDGQFPLRVIEGEEMVKRLQIFEYAATVIKEQGLHENGVWFYSDFRTTLLWKYWYAAYPDAKWIYVMRPEEDIIASCIKTGWMKAFKDPAVRNHLHVDTEEDGWRWWVWVYMQYIKQLKQAANVYTVDSTKLLAKDYSNIKEMVEFAGLEWQPIVADMLSFKVRK